MRLTNMITAVDLHACGEPRRVITGGVLDVDHDYDWFMGMFLPTSVRMAKINLKMMKTLADQLEAK